jgi:L-threonylcarbamoyladenylate synthase
MADAAANLLAGRLVAFPTETVYGLGADACNADAVARIYSVKGRPADHPLIVHVASMDGLGDWANDVPEYAIALARDFWPGPMTLVVKRSGLAGDFVTGGQDTVGVRVPNHPVALGLLEAFERVGGRGIAAPSANRFGHVSPTTAQAVSDELMDFLADADQILDGGSCQVGVESTIIDCTGSVPRILRPGAVTSVMIEESTGFSILNFGSVNGKSLNGEDIRVSGSLDSHYAPVARVYLNEMPKVGQGFIALQGFSTPAGAIRLSSPATIEEFATTLYESLRLADKLLLSEVVVWSPPEEGIGNAIIDRLEKASFKESVNFSDNEKS